MIELYSMVNEWVVSTGIPWWIWMVVGIIVTMLLVAGPDVFIGTCVWIFCFVFMPYVVVRDTGEVFLGTVLGLVIGFLVWAFALVIWDKMNDNRRFLH